MKPLTSDQIAELRRRYLAGESVKSLSSEFGAISTVMRHTRDLPHRYNPITPERISEVKRLYLAGETYRSISTRCHVSQRTVWEIVASLPRRNHKRQSTRNPLPVSMREEVRRRYVAGEPVKDIILATGCNMARVYRIVADLPTRQAHGRSIGSVNKPKSKHCSRPVEPVIEAYCRVCPSGVMTWTIDYDVQVATVNLTCPVCGTWYRLTQLVEVDLLNATLARLARAGEVEYGADEDC